VKVLIEQSDLIIYTLGHSTRTIEEFVEILKIYDINMLVDVRAIPRSRYNQQFNKENLINTMKTCNIKYFALPSIGGFRRPKNDSINLALDHSFRGYADFMQTKEFTENLLKIVVLAKENCLAMMCSEALPWSCHRILISDVLVVRHVKVLHIISKDSVLAHKLNELAHVEGTKISYPLFNPNGAIQKSLDDFGACDICGNF